MELQNLLGFFLPPVIDLINNRVADTRLRYWVSMLVCFVIGIVLNLDKLSDPKLLLANAAVVFTTAQITYNTYWEKSKERQQLKNVL